MSEACSFLAVRAFRGLGVVGFSDFARGFVSFGSRSSKESDPETDCFEAPADADDSDDFFVVFAGPRDFEEKPNIERKKAGKKAEKDMVMNFFFFFVCFWVK